MPFYLYKAVNEVGRQVRGEMTAVNNIDLEERLREIGLDLVDYKEARQRKGGMMGRVKIQDVILLCIQFEQLDRAGVPLLDSLADARDATDSKKLRDIMTEVFENVKSGEMLSQALNHHPRVFGDVFVGLVAAGEKTGNLSDAFGHLAEHMKWVNDIRRKVKKALGYPIVLMCVITAVITLLMLFVVPKLVSFLEAQGFELPLHTRALIAVSGFFVNFWYLIFIIPAISIVSLIAAYRMSPGFAYRFDAMMLHIPVIGSTIRKIDMARFTQFFSVMFKSGIDILECLATAQNVVANRVLKETIANVRTVVSEGSSLTSALRQSNQFPNLVVRMFKVGEESGNMNDSLKNINFFYEREVNDAVDAMVGMIQPALTIVLGLMVFWVVAAVFGPLYDSFSKMNV